MECSKAKERLSAYIEGVLPDEEKTFIDQHLKSCLNCSEAYADLRKTIDHVRDLKDVEPPLWMKQKVMAKVRAEVEKKKGLWHRLFYPLHIKLPLEAVGAVLVAVTALYIFQSVQPVLKEGHVDDLTEIPPERYSVSPGDHAEPSLEELSPVPAAEGPGAPAPRRSRDEDRAEAKAKVEAMEDVEAEIAPGPTKKKVDTKKAKKRVAIGKGSTGSPGVLSKTGESQDVMGLEEAPVFETDKERAPSYNAPASEGEAERKVFSSELRKREFAAGQIEDEALTILVGDVERASEDVEKLVAELGGRIIRKESFEIRNVISVRLDPDGMERFYERIRQLGEVKGDAAFYDIKGKRESITESITVVIEKVRTGR